MGFDLGRFEGEVDEELICPICSGVLENPVQAADCEHAFCSTCINDWLTRQTTCPIDRGILRKNQLKPVPRILRNLLSRLKITCSNSELGCQMILKMDTLQAHLQECDFNPKKPVTCNRGCDLTMPKDKFHNHDCITELKTLTHRQKNQITTLQKEVEEVRDHNDELRRELSALRNQLRSGSSPTENEDLRRWVSSLQMSRVTRWGGMISTPDAVLQTVIKRALIECGCPSSIVNDLMENSHERRWPPGLATLEARQHNRRVYESYICKRIPGKQAVIVMACDNEHMAEDMMLEPGLVMIFAHGVE